MALTKGVFALSIATASSVASHRAPKKKLKHGSGERDADVGEA